MPEYLVSLSFLICVVLLIRSIFRKAVSPRAIYALWLVVVIRMLLPVTLFEVDVNLNGFPQNQQTEQEEHSSQLPENSHTAAEPPQTAPAYPSHTMPTAPTVPDAITPAATITPETDTELPMPPEEQTSEVPEEHFSMNWQQIANLVWFIGAGISAVWVFFTCATYNRRLTRNRIFHRTVRGTKVYISEDASVPCISGVIPSIYITPEAANSKSETLIIIHEYVHLRHWDHIWSAVRAVALIVFWWNPLVWAAATVSKHDAELACDDAISAKLNDEARLKYARILLDTIPQKHRYATGLSSAPMKERILMLTKKHKNRWICLILAAVLDVSAVGCSFVGSRKITMENIKEQNGFTILSQETKEIALTLPSEVLPSYDDIVSAEGARLEVEDIPVFTTATTEIFLHTVGVSGHESEGVDKDVLYLGFDISHTLKDSGTVYTVNRVMNENGSNTYTSEVSLTQGTLESYNRKISHMGSGPADNFHLYIDAALYTALNGNVSIGITLNEIVYERGSEVKTYGPWQADSNHEDDISSNHLEIPEITLTQIDALPYSEEAAVFKDSSVSGNPAIFFFDDSLTFYFRNYLSTDMDAEYFTGELTLPDGFTDAKTVYVTRGAGSGEIFVSVEAMRDGEKEYLSYAFFFIKPPAGVWVMDELQVRRLMEALERKPAESDSFNPDSYAALIPNSSADVLFWHRISDTDDYLYFCAIREMNISSTGYTDAPPNEFAVYHVNSGKTEVLDYIEAVIPVDIDYDTVCPVAAMDGDGSGECEFILQLTEGAEAFYVSFANYGSAAEGNPLLFDFVGILGDERVNEIKAEYPDAFRKAAVFYWDYTSPEFKNEISGSSEEIFNLIIENKQSFYNVSSKESMLLSEYREKTDYSIKKYTVLDLNDDRRPELVLWLGYYENDYAGFMVMHRDGDTVYAHEFPYREINGLRASGIYTSSGSDYNMSFLKLDFDGADCTENVLAKREGDSDSIKYYIEGRAAAAEEFYQFYNQYSHRGIPEWHSYDIDEINDVDDWYELLWAEGMPEDERMRPAREAYLFIRELVKGESDIPELNGLGIKDYSIALTEESGYNYLLRFTFTVTGNSLPETLPPGTYTWTLYDGIRLEVYREDIPSNYEEGKAYSKGVFGLDRFEGISAVQAVHTYLSWMPYIWEVSPYGKWDPENVHIPYNYICVYYGNESLEISFDEMQRLMSEKFGIAVERPTDIKYLSHCEYFEETDSVRYTDTRGRDSVHRFLDVREEDGITYVTVQMFADRHRLIPSHKVQYAIGEGDVFLGCEIIETGKYEPRELS